MSDEYKSPVSVLTPNKRRIEINGWVVAGLLTGEYDWYVCDICAGGDPECGYCQGTGCVTLTEQERAYDWIDQTIKSRRAVKIKARISYLSRLVSRPIRALADWISYDAVDC